MPSVTIRIKVKILDYWIVDNYELGSSGTICCLLDVNGKLELIERELKKKWL